MTQTVLSNFINQNLQETAGFGNNKTQRRFFLTFLVAFVAYAGMAQTYTTKAPGNWNSAATWTGGVVPTPGAGKVINIKHAVTYNLTADLSIAGTINIEGDTLRFPSSFDKKVIINGNGILIVKNGGFLQDIAVKKAEMQVTGGRIIMENAKMTIGKLLKTLAGTKKTLKNSYLLVGEKYEMEGTSSNRSIDTLQLSTIESAKDGVFDIKDY
ncbi:hypothetical protein HMI54_010998, partial [Coelomomyces lativittatus]